MAQKKISAVHFSDDTQDFLSLLYKHQVQYVIVGGEAVIFYGHTRLTGDIDFFYNKSEENVKKLYRLLEEFWQGNIPSIKDYKELMEDDQIFQFGVPPNRIDLISNIGAISFDDAWQTREKVKIKINNKRMELYYISLDLLIKNKQDIGRSRDIDDLKFLSSLKK